MDLFGFKARKLAKQEEQKRLDAERDAERLEIAKAEKEKYKERKKMIDDYFAEEYTKAQKIIQKFELESQKEADKINSFCPNCGSRNVVQKIIQTKGELHGNGSSYNVSTFSYGTSKVDGKIDTYPVNRCKDCENEWYIAVPKTEKYHDPYKAYNSYEPEYLLRHIYEYLKLRYDPYDIREECNSLEEKREKFIEKTARVLDCYKHSPRYAMDYALFTAINGYSGRYFFDDIQEHFGDFVAKDAYTYEMPDELWKIVKKLVAWSEPETQQNNEQDGIQ